jgi:hypothetical protein
MLYTAVIKSYKFGGGICAIVGLGGTTTGTVDGRGGTTTGTVGDGRGVGAVSAEDGTGGREIEMLTDGKTLMANSPS